MGAVTNNFTFNEENGIFVSEFTVTKDFNLHIEKEESGFLFVQQRTSESGDYDSIKGADFPYEDMVVDYDFVGAIYPKHIRVVSKSYPKRAFITPESAMESNIA